MWLILLVAGSLLMGLSVNLFLLPLRLAEGGVVGVGIVLEHTLGVPVPVSFFLLNLPLAVVAWRHRGWDFVARSVLGIVAFTLSLAFTRGLHPITSEPLLGIVYGGLTMGVGLGLVLRAGATTGGTDLLASLIHHRLGLTVGNVILAVDALVLLLAGFTFGFEQALYSGLTLAISSRMVDYVQEGFYGAKGVTIITTRPQEIARAIMEGLERGVTLLEGTGGWTGQRRTIVYSVVQRSELTALKRVVYGLDPAAFVVVGDVREVLGEGFRPWEPARP